MARKRILILTAPVGGGHTAAAMALKEAFLSLYGDSYEVVVADLFKDLKIGAQLDKIAVSAYASSVRMLSSYPYKMYYRWSDANAEIFNKSFTAIFKDQLVDYLDKMQPDVVISTFPVASFAVASVIKQQFYRKVPVISVVTDAGKVQQLWLKGSEDAILVSTKDTIDYAASLGVSREKLHYLGFPVDRRFASLPSRQEARKLLGLEDKPTVFLTGGGLGLSGKLLDICRRLAVKQRGVQYLIIAGRNTRLLHNLRQIEFKDNVRTFGFVDNIPELLAASDLFVGKAGWLHLYEAMIARRPIVIIDVIPGQEEANADFVEQQGLGKVVRNSEEAAQMIIDLMKSPAELQKYQQAFENLNLDPYASDRIAKFSVGMLK